MFFILGFLIFFLSFSFTIINLNGNLVDFIDLPSIITILVPLAAILTATQSFKIFGAGFKAALFPKKEIADNLRGKAAALFRLLSKIMAAVSVMGTLIGWLNALLNLDFADPDALNQIGMNTAYSLVTLYYGLIFIALFESVVFILKKQVSREKP
jgi:flagellar motor component MotA